MGKIYDRIKGDSYKRLNGSTRARIKGTENGNCNMTACQKPGATWWNRGSYAWYCRSCSITPTAMMNSAKTSRFSLKAAPNDQT